MARPTKEQKEQMLKIETQFKRDNNEYQDFESECEYYANKMNHQCFMAYAMARECELRTHREYILIKEEIIKHGERLGITVVSPSGRKRKLYEISPLTQSHSGMEISISYPAINEFIIPYEYSDEYLDVNVEEDMDEKDKMVANYKSFLTRNKKNDLLIEYSKMPTIEYHTNSEVTHKSALIKIDFTKPIQEIIAFVSKIKNDFDNDSSKIKSLDEYLGIEPAKETYSCNFTDCDIYKSGTTKPLSGRLSDALFIYDCKKLGLTKEYILSEINRYWNEIKNLNKDKMSDNTLKEYLDFAIKQIDEKGYKDFLEGVKN